MSACAVRWKQCTGCRPPDDLVGGRVGPVAFEQLPLVLVLEKRVHAVCHCVAGGFVARHREQDDEECELDIVHRLTVEVGLDQPGDDVVGRAASALLGHGVGVAHQLGVRRRHSPSSKSGSSVFMIALVQSEQLLAVGFWHADQIGDRQQRQAHRDVVDEVATLFFRCGRRRFRGPPLRASPRARRLRAA